MAAKDKKTRGGITIIKREEVVEGGHHGGAWKVAYADFVTAMMAFFLLMWLLNATTEAQRKGLADYFAPSNAFSHGSSGTGQPFGGNSPLVDGDMVSDKGARAVLEGRAPAEPEPDPDKAVAPRAKALLATEDNGAEVYRSDTPKTTRPAETGVREAGGGVAEKAAKAAQKAEFLANAGAGADPRDPAADDSAALRTAQDKSEREARAAERERQESAAFNAAAQQIREAVRNDPVLAELGRQLAIDLTPEGLRIQLLDEDRQPMFATGSSVPNERARALLQKIAPVLARLPEDIAIAGHTDATPFRGTDRTNWELSSERAQATRRALVEGGLLDQRFRSVTGNADRDPLLPADPLAAANRRIAIMVLKTAGKRS